MFDSHLNNNFNTYDNLLTTYERYYTNLNLLNPFGRSYAGVVDCSLQPLIMN